MKKIVKFFLLIILFSTIQGITADTQITAEWTEVNSDVVPFSSDWSQLKYDTDANLVLMASGTNGSAHDKSWIFDPLTEEWEVVNSTNNPHERYYHSMAYAPSIKKFIMYGGFGGSGSWLDDTWSFDTSTGQWEELTTIGSPGSSARGGLEYIPSTESLILFSAWKEGFQVSNEVWEFFPTNNTWIQLETTNAPAPAEQASLSYNPAIDRVILYSAAEDLTYLYDHANLNWTVLETSNSPATYLGFSPVSSIVYNPDIEQSVICAGFRLFALDTTNEKWDAISTNLDSDEERFVPRQFTYMDISKKFLLQGGYKVTTPNAYYSDTFVAVVSEDGVPITPVISTTDTDTSSSTTSEDTDTSSSTTSEETTSSTEEAPLGIGVWNLAFVAIIIAKRWKN